ncbi:MAG: anti-sigma factor [Rhizobiaceae bacterium]
MSAREFSDRDIHLALDGELPEEERAALESWLDANPERKAHAVRFAADRERLREALSGIADEPVPVRLREIVGTGERSRRNGWRGWLAIAAALIFAVGLGAGYVAGLTGLGFRPSSGEGLAEGALAAHAVYSAERRHAVEVAVDDRDHLKTWLSNRTGLTLVLPDLSAEGFGLLGGRLLPQGEGVAAHLLYEDSAGARVSIYVTSSADPKSWGKVQSQADGTTAIWWFDKGVGCAVVSALPGERMSAVARQAWRQILAGEGA